jgi:hypothetical protein
MVGCGGWLVAEDSRIAEAMSVGVVIAVASGG